MQKTGNITSADLHAYCDGKLDEAAKSEVEAYLLAHPDKAREVASWQLQNQALHALYDNVLNEPLPDNLNPRALADKINARGRHISLSPSWRNLAAMLALFAVGVTSGWFGHGAFTDKQQLHRPMVRQALAAHSAYSVEVLHPVEVSATNQQHLVAWLSKRLKTPIKAPDLTQEGFSLLGGRLLPRSEGVAAQFMYEETSGKRMTLYVIRNKKEETSSFRFAKYKNMNAFYWLNENVSYVLVGNITKNVLSNLARKVYDELDG